MSVVRNEMDAKKWAGGSKELEELLVFCIKNEIVIIDCCAGNSKTGQVGKITIQISDEQTRKNIVQLASEMLESKGLKDIEFGQGVHGTVVSFYSKERKEDKLFGQLLDILREIVNGQEKVENSTIKRIQDIVREAYDEGRELNIDVQENGQRFCISSRIDTQVLTEEELFEYIKTWKVRRKI